MRFKIQGEQEEIDEKKVTTVIELLGKRAIEQLIEFKMRDIVKDLNRDIDELKQRVLSLEEDMAIKRKEFLKFKNE